MASKTTNSSKTTNDFAGIMEGGGSISGNVFNNDTFSSAKAVTSVKIGNLTLPVSPTGITALPGKYGTFYFKADGSYTYTLDESKAALQALAEGQSDNEHPVYYTVNNTTELTSNLIIRVKGTNDAATITGDETGSVDEDTSSTATGILLADDVDNPDNTFQVSSGNATYGSFSIDAAGNWTYTLDNTNTAVNALNDSDSLPDSFVVKSADGTEHTVNITITGTNDASVISAVGNGDYSVTEDSDSSAGGTLNVTDVDNINPGFQDIAPSALAGIYGTFTFDSSNGTWGYLLNNAAAIVQNLNTGDAPTDTLTVTSLDGTPHDIKVTIHGADEPLGGSTTGGSSGSTTNAVKEYTTSKGLLVKTDLVGTKNLPFDSNDILKVSANNGGNSLQIKFDSSKVISHGSYGNTTINDTQLDFHWLDTQGDTVYGTAILVDYTGPVIVQLQGQVISDANVILLGQNQI